jgi:hypothetical protein
MIDKMDKKVFAIWIGICVLGALLFSYIPNSYASDTSNSSAFEQCIADNNLTTDMSVVESYLENIPEPTEEMANEYIKEYLEKGEATFGGKEAEENDKKLSEEIRRYTNLLLETCGDKVGSSN